MILTDVAVRNRATVAVLTVFILVAGLYSYLFALPREAAPDVPMPLVMVTTAYEGVAPEDVETSVTMKIEKELAGLKGLKRLSSSSAEGISMITAEFNPDVVIEDALQYVRDRVDIAKPDLPPDAEEPSIREINIAEFPFMLVSISGDVSPVRLKAIADQLEDRIESVPGVLGVDVMGALEREIRLEVDPDRLSAYNLTVGELLSLVPAENVNISAGALETKGVKFNVRVPAEFVDPGEIDHLLLAVRGGLPVYLTDVAEIVDTFKDRNSFSRLDGEPSITLAVRKRIGADLLPISDAVRYILARARARVPEGVKLEVTDDQGIYVRRMVA
ncbi:MAG: efflux RND transporter permease subunit, partial [Planctomycetota bacterium]